mgnify:CR=1 FL=1
MLLIRFNPAKLRINIHLYKSLYGHENEMYNVGVSLKEVEYL